MNLCAIVASNEETRNIAASALQTFGIAAVFVPSIAGLPVCITNTPVCGILLDLPTMMRATPEEKHILRELPESFPFAKFRVSSSTLITSGIPLERFINTCQNFWPRVMRAHPRVVQHLAVRLARESGFTHPEKTITLNISQGGCLLYTAEEWSLGDEVWLHFHEDNSLALGSVRSVVPWGRPRQMPSIGIEYRTDPAPETAPAQPYPPPTNPRQ
jgi:hypothetical protein